MKINQAQIRVVRAMLRGKAQDAVTAAVAKTLENSKANSKLIDEACAKVLAKYEKKLVISTRPDLERIRDGWSQPVSVQCDEAILDKIRSECNAAIKALPLNGAETFAYVQFPALNMTQENWRSETNGALQVPSTEVDKWKELACEIDSSFMDGDAKKLAWIIGNFK